MLIEEALLSFFSVVYPVPVPLRQKVTVPFPQLGWDPDTTSDNVPDLDLILIYVLVQYFL
jgi:hypothetical protein